MNKTTIKVVNKTQKGIKNKMDEALSELDSHAGNYLIHMSILTRVAKKYNIEQIRLWKAFTKYANDKYGTKDYSGNYEEGCFMSLGK
jgi:hypothetical protein